ncbi:MAG: alanine racemase [Promethearchaeota archaeon]|nr:MAG: alanine racemase [Candidatus Lokiarchaeota archaeon]
MKIISGNPFLKKEHDTVFIDSVSVNEIVSRFKTPLLIFLENRIRDNIRTFTNIFNSEFKNFHCYYSFKANFLTEICKIVNSEGIGAEIVGLPELNLALKIGFPPDKIIIGGPFLSKELIELSVKSKVKELIIYSLDDIKKINSIAQKLNRIQNICIRVNSQKYDSKLGVKLDKRDASKLEQISNNYSNIKINSILSHYSTQMNDLKQYKKNLQAIIDNLKLLSEYGIRIDNINLGGGFPEATVMPLDQLRIIAKEIKTTLEDSETHYTNIYFEPGRYFVGDAGLFISKVIKVGQKRWIFLNIGNHICPKFARCSLRFYNISQINEPHKYKTSIAGIIPTDQDVLVKDYFFTENLREGDKVLVANTGAYCLTFSNRFPYSLPKILLVKDNNLRQIFDPEIDKDFSLN